MFATEISNDGDGVSALILSPRPFEWEAAYPIRTKLSRPNHPVCVSGRRK